MAKIIFWNTFQQTNYPFLARPLGPHLLAKWLENHGHSAKVIDFSSYLTTEKLVNLTEKYIDRDTVAIGVSNTFWSDFRGSFNRDFKDFREPQWVMDARQLIENKYPKIKWILGGAARNFGNYRLDWQVFPVGYAEDAILKFIDEKSTSSFSIGNQGICWRHGNSIDKNEVLSLELARGCHFKCKFCTFPLLGKEKNSYLRNFNYVKEELIFNYNEFGVTRYNIVDDTINESPEKIKAWAKTVNELPFKIEWLGYNRLDLISTDKGTADLLKDSGLKAAFFGIESLHPQASKAIGKGWMGKYAKDYLPKLREIWADKISITGQFIVGLPYEPMESILETNQWLLSEDCPIDYYQWGPLHMDRSWQVSEFDKNYRHYGIRFPHPIKNKYWEHELMNFFQAQDIAQKFNEDPLRKDKVRVFCWQFPALLMYGYSFEEIRQFKAYKVVKELDIENKAKQFLINYYNDQINL